MRKIAYISAGNREQGETVQFVASSPISRNARKGEFSAIDGMFVEGLLPGLTWRQGVKKVELHISAGPVEGGVRVWCFGSATCRMLSAMGKPELEPQVEIKADGATVTEDKRTWLVKGGSLYLLDPMNTYQKRQAYPDVTEDEAFPLYIGVSRIIGNGKD